MPDIQGYIKYILENHVTLPTKPSIYIYINMINKRLALKTIDGYKQELKAPETMKLFGNTKKVIVKTKNGENVPSLEMV